MNDDIIDFRNETANDLADGEVESHSSGTGYGDDAERRAIPVVERGVVSGADIDWSAELAGASGGEIDDFNEFRAAHGLTPVSSRTGRKKIRSFSISDEAVDGLRFLASNLKALHGGSPSVSKLLEEIGTFRFELKDRRTPQRGL
jgi:hypothetical protein